MQTLGALFKEDEVISVEDGPVKRVVCSGGIYEARAVDNWLQEPFTENLGFPERRSLEERAYLTAQPVTGLFSAIR